ncbi:MAG: hypothetical protein WCC30_03095, partial [Candidatus Dormiibacterota bacterium]|jgi:hypothetical protein
MKVASSFAISDQVFVIRRFGVLFAIGISPCQSLSRPLLDHDQLNCVAKQSPWPVPFVLRVE